MAVWRADPSQESEIFLEGWGGNSEKSLRFFRLFATAYSLPLPLQPTSTATNTATDTAPLQRPIQPRYSDPLRSAVALRFVSLKTLKKRAKPRKQRVHALR